MRLDSTPTSAPLHGGDILTAAARWHLDPAEILDFSANINPAGPPFGALAAAREALWTMTRYPDPFAPRLRQALARRHSLPPEAIMVTAGGAEAIHLLGRLAAGRRAALPVPCFAEYSRAARAVGAAIIPWAGAAAAPPPPLTQGDLLFLCNPHNPTGRLLSPAQVLATAEQTPATVIVDEAFIDLTDPGETGSVIPHLLGRPNLVVLRSLTKFYALPGLRVGYAIARPELVSALDAVRDPWSVSAPAQAAALAALADTAYFERTRTWIRTERPFLAGALASLPGYSIETAPSANFILVRAPRPAHEIQQALGPRGILIRDCRSFDGLTEYHVRLAIRSRAENLRLLAALVP